MTWKVPTEYIQQNDELDDEEDFWSDPVGEAEALDKIGLTTEPKVFRIQWHCASQPTTSTLGMSGVKYLQNPTAGDTAQPFWRRQGATAPGSKCINSHIPRF